MRIELVLFPPTPAGKRWISPAYSTPRISTYRPNGSDRLPKYKRPLILRSTISVLSPTLPSTAHSSLSFAGISRLPSAGKSKLQFAAHPSPPPSAALSRPPFSGKTSPPTAGKSRSAAAAHSRQPFVAHANPPPFAAQACPPPPAAIHVPLWVCLHLVT